MKLQFERLLADEPLECRNSCFVFLDHVGSGSILVEAAGLVSLDPDANQVARYVMAAAGASVLP